MSVPFFSIIIPTYNRASLVSRTIDSLLKQSFKEYEIIVVDDGGSDNTKEVVEGFNDPRIKYYWKKNAERGAARNYGLSLATGKWINFFDSDDIAYPQHLQVAYDHIHSDASVKVFHTSYDFMDVDTGKIIKQTVRKGDLNKKIHKSNGLSCNGVFIKKEIADKNRFTETRCVAGSEDWLLWLLLSKEFKITGLPEITTTVILHSGRSMVTAMGKGTENRATCFLETMKEHPVIEPLRSNVIREFYSLAALYYSMEKKRKDAWRCTVIAIKAKPLSIFSRRFLAIVKHLI